MGDRDARRRAFAAVLSLLLLLPLAGPGPFAAAALAQVPPPEALKESPVGGAVPGGVLGTTSDAELWRSLRRGITGTVTIPDKKAAQLIQSEGDNWRALRNGPLSVYGVRFLAGVIVLLAVFFLIRGRVRIEHGRAGVTITRFNTVERMGHWLIASSFIILALTGLNLLYGRYFLPDLIGAEAFALITRYGKLAHNTVAFAFMLGIAWVFVAWVRHNLPSRADIGWLLRGGGIFVRGVHPPAARFNAGQKIVFWLVVLGGLSLSLSGWALIFPFTTHMFSGTFAAVNAVLGTDLPTALTPVQEQQLSQLWHAIVALGLTAVVIAHIYIGTLGMEGAFDAMGSGEVDLNWAREHHSLWVKQEEERMARKAERSGGRVFPAE